MSDSARFALSFEHLRRTNVARCQSPQGFAHALSAWDVMHWGCATAGEIGEACNVAKKLGRYQIGNERANKPGENQQNLLIKLSDEIADGVIYADLWLASQGQDLGDAIVRVFNRKSDELGVDIKL